MEASENNRFGRPRLVQPDALYGLAHQLFWGLQRLAEGGYRSRFNKERYKRSVRKIEKMNLSLSDEQKARLVRRKDAGEAQLSATRAWLNYRAAERAGRRLRVPGEPDVLDELLEAKT